MERETRGSSGHRAPAPGLTRRRFLRPLASLLAAIPVFKTLPFGSASAQAQQPPREAGAIYVSPAGDDVYGTGASDAPLRQPRQATLVARPGDTIYLRPGIYAPFEIARSGTQEAPITYTTLPGEEHQAIIRGDLQEHVVNGGPGLKPQHRTRDIIRIDSKDNIHIRNLTIEDAWRSGIYVVGTQNEVHGHHVFAGNVVRRTGSSGIFVCGFRPDHRITPEQTETLRTIDVLIERNDISATNAVTDYNNHKRVPGGVNEAISVAAAAGDVITRFNDIHDSRQYGVDYKAGVRGGEIYGNRIWNMERYGIYLDAGRRFVDDIDVYNNQIWNCGAGIVLAREADFNKADPVEDFTQRLRNINIYNNVMWDLEIVGLFCQGHPGDGPYGVIEDVRIRFNTVFNAARRGSGREARLSSWADREWLAAGIVNGFEFIGNILWRSDGKTQFLDEFGGRDGFLVSENLVDQDPLFADPDTRPPDLSLLPNSPAMGVLDAKFVSAPFDLSLTGVNRQATKSIGAF
ncbi:MAG: right-handed parallel beta-helix repeat-containing protein [Paracoccaceae bacterium]|nr:right-handed parallel beta-helix repeat-containing protein [Paracoccaceae bacterium]